MIKIRPITPDEWMIAKRVVYRVAFDIFGRGRPLEEFIAYHESIHELKDMDDIQESYFDNGGTFLGMFRDGEMICTGALRRMDRETCELKRLWLLNDLFVKKDFRGQGISKLLIDRCKQLVKETNAKGLMLETEKTNAIGNWLYPQEGFVLNKTSNFYLWTE